MTGNQTGPADVSGYASGAGLGVDGLPPRYGTPEGYDIDRAGVWALKTVKDEEVRVRVAWAPLVILRTFLDPAGDQFVELAWTDRGRTITRIVPRSVAKSGKRLVTALGDAGLPVIDATARGAEHWLAALEATNQKRIERMHLARWLGWQPDGTFVTAQDTPRRIEPRYEEQAPALAAHHPQGGVRGLADGHQAATALPGGADGPVRGPGRAVVDPARAGFVLHRLFRPLHPRQDHRRDGRAVVLGRPDGEGHGLFSWRTTMLAIEKRLNLVQGLPVVIDETRVVKVPELVDQVLYQVPKNHGQARGGGWPSGLPWRTIIISTGEQPALSFTTHQGAAARVLAIGEPPFGTDGPESAAAAIAVRDGLAEHFGTAGPEFIARLRDGLAKPNGPERLAARHKVLTETYRGTTDMTGRRAPMVAALALAAELAHGWGIVPFPPPEQDVWMRLFTAADPTDNRPEMALDIVREYVASHGRELWRPHTSDDQPHGGWIGRRIEVNGVDTVALLPERLKEVLGRAGYDLAAVVPGWREIGALVEDPKFRPPYIPTRKLAGGKPRMYVFTPEALAGPTDEDDDEE